ncbi:MAG: efflux RND transporter periplasmic adaptor subunit, partial [Planctomycetota bacterium]|nr:efflux RND transporter periplasmic adaptor subunit [Planctomycetota bacterium]
VVMRGGRSVVFVYGAGRVRAVSVQRGELRGRRVIVEGPLNGDEQVVLAPAVSLSDGDRVEIAE